MKLLVHTDGGARGNPGKAAVGVVVHNSHGEKLFEFGEQIGEATNNVAEYRAVEEALKKIRESTQEVSHIDFYLDSTLVVNQLNGLFKVKDARLRELLSQIRVLEQEVGGVIRYNAVPREQNRRADFLVNQALDEGVR